MTEQSVVAVGMPAGAEVYETGINGGAAKTPAPVHQTDTAGMSATQAEAAAWVDSHRAEIPGTSNAFLLKQYREATQHAFGSAPAPSWLQQSEDAATELNDLGAKAVNSDMPELAAAFQPITEQDTTQLINRAVITTSVPREVAAEVVAFAKDAQLPRGVTEGILDRLGKHAQDGFGLDAEPLTQQDVQTLATECARMLGGDEKAQAEVTLARTYLRSVGGDALLATVDQRAGSLGFDPRLILQLSMMARARGLDK
jgi:hypothetical protein